MTAMLSLCLVLCSTPLCIFTPSILLLFSPFNGFMEEVCILTHQPFHALSNISSRLKAPFSGAKPTRRAAELIFTSHVMQWVLEVHSRARNQGFSVVHLPPLFCPRLHYKPGREGIISMQTETLRGRKKMLSDAAVSLTQELQVQGFSGNDEPL